MGRKAAKKILSLVPFIHVPFCRLCKYAHQPSATTKMGMPSCILSLGGYLGYS
jgi:hypothetical protein